MKRILIQTKVTIWKEITVDLTDESVDVEDIANDICSDARLLEDDSYEIINEEYLPETELEYVGGFGESTTTVYDENYNIIFNNAGKTN